MAERPATGTALVTGASSGIGEAIARELARRGYRLALVARSADALQRVADDLAGRYGVAVSVLPTDLADEATVAALPARLGAAGLAVDVLVNNAGFAAFGRFDELPLDEQLDLLKVNVLALTHLTRLLLPAMVARRRGRVLNVASTAAFMPGPLMAVYYASKAYALSFSEALHTELRGTGVTVTALCPGPTASGFQDRAQMADSKLVAGKALMSAEAVAVAGVAAMAHGKALVIPGRQHQLQAFFPRLLPRALVPRLVQRAQARTGH